MLDSFFKLKAHHTSIKTEIIAGLSTFLTMSYIIFINPAILAKTGMDHGAVFVATCLAAALGSALMGLLANYPIALAPGMGLNVYFTYNVVLGSGYSWQLALGAVFISGLIFLSLSLLPIRSYLINSIPASLKIAIVAGIGLFLCMIGFKSAGILVNNHFALINLHQPTTLLAILGFFMIIGLQALRVLGAIIISILTISTLGILFHYGQFKGFFSMPPSIMPTLMQMEVKNAFSLGLATIVFAFLFVDLFDNTGTLIGVAHKAGLMDKRGRLPRLNRALLADSLAAILGAVLGTSTTTSYVESTVGVKAGGKTGLTALVVALLFIMALFLAPLAESIPAYATAPALVYVACLMARSLRELNWKDVTEYFPALITAVTMPLTFSVADGMAFGFISYTIIKIFSGRFRDLNWALVILTVLFVAKYAYLK